MSQAPVPRTAGHNTKGPAWKTTAIMVAIIIAALLLREHWDHIVGKWAYLLLLICPAMHFFMHGGHGHGNHAEHNGESHEKS